MTSGMVSASNYRCSVRTAVRVGVGQGGEGNREEEEEAQTYN